MELGECEERVSVTFKLVGEGVTVSVYVHHSLLVETLLGWSLVTQLQPVFIPRSSDLDTRVTTLTSRRGRSSTLL